MPLRTLKLNQAKKMKRSLKIESLTKRALLSGRRAQRGLSVGLTQHHLSRTPAPAPQLPSPGPPPVPLGPSVRPALVSADFPSALFTRQPSLPQKGVLRTES